MAGNLTAMIASIFSGSAVTPDPYYEYTTLLLPGNGTNGAQNNTFLDASTNNFTITRNGNTTQGTFSPFSQTGWSNYFDGSGDSLTLTGVNLSSGNWTIECFVYIQSFATTLPHIFSIGTDGNNRFALYRNSATSKFNFITVNSGVYVSAESTTSPTVGQWYHVAVVSNSGTRTLYVNGAAEVTSTSAINNGTSYAIGNLQYTPGVNDPLTGYISNFRVVTSAVYTGNFTPPTAPLTAISGTSLLTCQSNRFIDTNTQAAAKTITRNGDTSVQAFSPFNPSASWSAATNGGSGYFDGNGDYLQLADSTAWDLSGDYTIEMWINVSAISSSPTFFQIGSSSLFWYISSATKYLTTAGSLSMTASTAITLNSWNHIAICRSGSSTNNTKMYLNGVKVAETTNTTSFTGDGSNGLRIGAEYPSNYYLNGYISNLRVVNGTAVYTADFTPPTSPLTAITNTSLLLNFTNAGIYDATSKNDLETVGNAQISNAVTPKWGSTSIKFDGTGDYLTIPTSQQLNLSNGNWTIECWVNAQATGYSGLLSWRNTGATSLEPDLYVWNTGVIVWYFNTAAQITGTTNIVGAGWVHVAVAKSGSSTRLFVNGNQEGSTLTDNNTYLAPNTTLKIGAQVSASQWLNGYMQDVRITKGYARYTANFTPPTAAFPTL